MGSMSGSSTAVAPPLAIPSSAYLVWKELTAVLPNSGICNGAHRQPKKLINGLTGYAVPGRILAVMGPSGSGKSTLLDSLAGRLAKNVVLTGNILLNGRKTSLNYGAVAYVTQENTLLNTLTVRETITYSAQLRLPARLSKQQVMTVVESTIDDMGLQDCADTVIGSWHVRGISGGEKKRLSIGLEILNQPSILFLDEPTSGLDSMSAFFVIQTLKQMALDGNKTIVSSIHQPSSEVFAMLDDLYLLSGGETVYFGDINSATTFFAEAGFPCPSKRNPSDHFLRCINSDFDKVNTILNGSLKIRAINREAESSSSSSSDPLLKLRIGEIKTMLIESYRNSEYASTAIKQIQEISKIEGLTLEIRKGSHATWLKQLTTLTRRSFVNMSRDLGYYWARIVTYMFVALCVGSIYFNVGTTYTSIMARTACGGFVANFMTFMSIGGFPSFIEEMKVFYKERENGHYGVAVYILSNFLSSFPFLATASITSGLVLYSMVKLRKGFEHYAFYTINLYSNIALIEGLMMVVASIVPNYLMGIITGAGIIGIMLISSGFFRLLPDLPKPIFRYPVSYISYSAWSLQGEYKNDFIGLVFDPMVPGKPPITGEYVVEKMYGVSLKRSKWFDLSMILLLMLIYRLLFFVVLKFNERGPSFIRQIYARATLRTQNYEDSNNNNDDDNYIANTHSFRRSTGLSLSSRHQPLHPLALQEGLSSPLP